MGHSPNMPKGGSTMEYLATFPNQLQAMEYARALTRSGIPSRMMPRPRALEASCGTAVRFSSRQPVDILLTLAPVKTLYRVEQSSYWPVG